ncbi:MAG TPA: GAF domain-containing sensor histidine kinase [Anaerolineae bacterium]|nr:GAF domain-containing sensor histidine kinase [Anaerolineae bacterium]HPL27082.1 GAF domain-containing sensor histidine kinase [Anaerolineae bacterium]
MQTLLSSWIADFTDEANRRLAAQQRRTQAILEMVQVVSSSLALDVVLQRVTRGLAAAVNAHRCWVFLLDQDQANITIWSDAAPAAGVGVRVQPLVGQSVPLASSALACAAVQQKAPVATGDALSDPCAQGLGCQLGLRSALAVPLVFRERVLAVAVAATLESDHSFAPEEIELAAGIANAVAPAIENARLYEQVAQMATNEERARLARDLHDQLSQALGYLELKASSTRLSLSEGGVEQAEAGLVEIEQAVEQLYEQVHEAIFRLRAAVGFGSEFLPALRKHLLEYGMYYGVEAQVVVEEEESLAGFAPRVGMQVFYIILEALANVRKHSHARRAWVRFEAEGAGVCVTVEDDGRGFDPQQAPQANSRHFGLQTMRERAQSVGGRVTVVSQVGRGTRVVIWVPQETGDQS